MSANKFRDDFMVMNVGFLILFLEPSGWQNWAVFFWTWKTALWLLIIRVGIMN